MCDDYKLYELTFWSFYLIGDTVFGKNVYLKYIALGKSKKKLKNELDNENDVVRTGVTVCISLLLYDCTS